MLRPRSDSKRDVLVQVVAATSNPVAELELEGETVAHALLRTRSGVLCSFRASVLGDARMAHAEHPLLCAAREGRVGAAKNAHTKNT